MKKLVIIVLCVAVVIVGVGLFYQTQKKGFSIEHVLPQGALVYVRLNDVEKNMREMASMPFWQAIENINYDFLIKQNVISPQQGAMIDLIRTRLSEVLANPLFKKLFGQEVAVAVYPLDRDIGALIREMKMFNPQLAEELFSGIFLVTRVDPDVQFAEFLTRSLSQLGGNISQGQVEYKGEIIRTISVSGVGMKFAFVRLKDLLVMGIGEEAARTSIDVYKKSEPSLTRDPRFMKIQSTFLDPAGIAGYFDFETFIGILRSQAGNLAGLGAGDSGKAMSEKVWDEALSKITGFETFAFSSQLGPIMKFSGHIMIDPEKLDPQYASLHSCPSEVNKTIDFTPRDVLGYQWSNCHDLIYYWKEIKKELAKADTPVSKIDEIEAQIGLSIEKDILPALGDEFGGYLSDIQIGGFFPIPKLLFFVQIKNKTKIQHMLDQLKNQPIAMIQNENYNGVSLTYLALPLGEIVQPGYCFLGDYLLMATSRQLLKDSIDASANTAMSLVANPAFQEIDFGLTDKNRSVQFVRIGKMIEKVKGIIGWSNQWIAAQERKAQAFKAGSEKPLEEVNVKIATQEDELTEMHDTITALEDKIWDLEDKREDITAQQAQLSDLRAQVGAIEMEISDGYERKEELEAILQKGTKNIPDTALRQSYMNEIINPILESLKSIESYGLRVTSDKDVYESSIFLKVAD